MAAAGAPEIFNCAVVKLHALMHLPLRQHFWEILALVRAAAFVARKCGRGDGVGDHEHVAQVEPFEALQIEGGGVARWMLAKLGRESGNLVECGTELRAGAERADVIGHGGLQMRDHRGGISGRFRFRVGAYQIKRCGGVLRLELWLRHAFRALGGAAPGAAAEHQGLGDGIA